MLVAGYIHSLKAHSDFYHEPNYIPLENQGSLRFNVDMAHARVGIKVINCSGRLLDVAHTISSSRTVVRIRASYGGGESFRSFTADDFHGYSELFINIGWDFMPKIIGKPCAISRL